MVLKTVWFCALENPEPENKVVNFAASTSLMSQAHEVGLAHETIITCTATRD